MCKHLFLSYLNNVSFWSGMFPQSLKYARVLPLHKSDSRIILSNYRPISLLSSWCNLIEKSCTLDFTIISKSLNCQFWKAVVKAWRNRAVWYLIAYSNRYTSVFVFPLTCHNHLCLLRTSREKFPLTIFLSDNWYHSFFRSLGIREKNFSWMFRYTSFIV